MEASDQERRHWHVGREIPIASLAMIAVQTVGIVWWASDISATLRQTSKDLVVVQIKIDEYSKGLYRSEAQLEFMAHRVEGIESRIRALEEMSRK